MKVDVAEVIVVTGTEAKDRYHFFKYLKSRTYSSRYCVIDNVIECGSFDSAIEIVKVSDKRDFIIDNIMFGRDQPSYGDLYQTSNWTKMNDKALTIVLFSEDPTLKSTFGYMKVYKATDAGFVFV
jgi:hypothetical protein